MTASDPAARRLLFLGDSITDCDRREDPEGLGHGYVRLVAERLRATEPGARVINRGIGGDRVRDLVARFDVDCLDHRPDLVTIFAGVNDTWRAVDSEDPTTPRRSAHELREMLGRLDAELPGAPVIVILPFVLDVGEQTAAFRTDLDARTDAVRSVALEAGVPVVESQRLLDQAIADGRAPHALAGDGIHPTEAGHRIIADAWLATAVGPPVRRPER